MGLIISSCNATAKQAEKLGTSCYNLQRIFNHRPKIDRELDDLIYLTREMPPQFSAAGFFQIRRTTLLSVIGNLTIYFIIREETLKEIINCRNVCD